MLFAIFVSISFGLISLVLILNATTVELEKTCLTAARDIESLTVNVDGPFNEPLGTWQVYKTNSVLYKCKTFQYISSIVNDSRSSWAILSSSDSLDTVEYVVSVVPKRPNKYVATRKHDGAVQSYYLLQSDNDITVRLGFCGFSCEIDGVYIENFSCFIKNKDQVTIIDKLINQTALPMRPNTVIYNLYKDCNLPYRRKIDEL